jgi:hypothetical protein
MYTICTPSVHDPYTICTPWQHACPWLARLSFSSQVSGFIPHPCPGFLPSAFRPATLPSFSRFKVQGSRFEVRGALFAVGCSLLRPHKPSEYASPLPPPSDSSGSALVPPWYLPIPIEHPTHPIFNQAALSTNHLYPSPLPTPARATPPNAPPATPIPVSPMRLRSPNPFA